MTIIIPAWLLWVFGVPVGIALLFFAGVGIYLIIGLSKVRLG
jgi:hypothetical protein